MFIVHQKKHLNKVLEMSKVDNKETVNFWQISHLLGGFCCWLWVGICFLGKVFYDENNSNCYSNPKIPFPANKHMLKTSNGNLENNRR